MRSWGIVCLGGVLVFSGCGKEPSAENNSLPTFDVPKLDSQREEFLYRFPLLNEAEEESAPRDSVSRKAPFGVLIYMPKPEESSKGAYCSASHIFPGQVATNAHCIEKDRKPENYFVVFYNRRNWKRYERVVAFDYVGNSGNLDVAVVRVNPEVARQWDTVSGAPLDSRHEIGRMPPELHKVVLWSFNPFENNHPHLVEKFRGPGMRFAPKHCDASRTRPRIEGIGLDAEGKERARIEIVNTVVSEKIHWFVDACDARPVHGNSGSLITESADIARMVGLYHWNIPADSQGMGRFSRFEYRGNSNVTQNLAWQDLSQENPKHRDFYGVASDFGQLLSRL